MSRPADVSNDDASTGRFAPPAAIRDWSQRDDSGAETAATLFSCHAVGARRLDNARFIDAIARAYGDIRKRVQRSPHPHLVRLWNGVPGIHDRVDAVGDRDRYMLFNAGRFAAMRDWFGNASDLVTFAPAASGVGIDGDDFVLHALAMPRPGTSIQNPRQTPAALYSRRYGPLPPCFARATRVEHRGRATLLVSGTAAIVGEDSRHDGDAARQLKLTVDNLAAVVEAAGGEARPDVQLAAYASLRIYLPPATPRHAIEPTLLAVVDRTCRIEFVAAELCRRELLVEIEGVADLTRGIE